MVVRQLMRGQGRVIAVGMLAVLGAITMVHPAIAGHVPSASLPRVVAQSGSPKGYLAEPNVGRFTPRGVNYIRLTEVFWPGGAVGSYHSTFEPGRYTPAEAERVLAALARDGYNTVRVFIDGGGAEADLLGRPHGLGRGANHDEALYAPYMANVADFVRRGAGKGIRTLVTFERIPDNAYYDRIVGAVDPATNIDGVNLYYLHEGHVAAKEEYLRAFVADLTRRLGPGRLGAVLAYETDNEAYVSADAAPFNRLTDTVRTADGNTYDMSSAAERQQAQDANFVSYANRMVDAVHTADPRALVTMGAFTYGAVGKPGPNGLPVHCERNCPPTVDYRYPVRPASLTTWSRLSFLDLHVYPVDQPGNAPYTLTHDLATIEWASVRGPVVLGEFGAFRDQYRNDIVAAAYAMRDLQVQTCAKAMSGWWFWTYDTDETADQRRLFTLLDADGAINGQLAPIVRRDPCRG
jgi:hypothetical protein